MGCQYGTRASRLQDLLQIRFSGSALQWRGGLGGESPIAVDASAVSIGNLCRFSLTGLSNTETYCCVVTTHDTAGNESDYSNEICFNCEGRYEFPKTSEAPMPCYTVNKMMAKDKIAYRAELDKIKIMGSLDFGPGSDPFDPPPAEVVVTIDGDDIPIPGDWFVRGDMPGQYSFKGNIPDVGKVRMHLHFDECFWKILIKGKDASGLYESDEVTVGLTIGNYFGEYIFNEWTKRKSRDGKRIANFKADPQVNCCSYECTEDYECGPGAYCKKSPGDCEGPGICAPTPVGYCYEVWAPVCGCDGNTYSNACYAGLAGVNVAYEGVCVP